MRMPEVPEFEKKNIKNNTHKKNASEGGGSQPLQLQQGTLTATVGCSWLLKNYFIFYFLHVKFIFFPSHNSVRL
jgi:hypothetical protein